MFLTSFRAATGTTQGISGLFGTPVTVSGTIASCKNFNGFLLAKTTGDTKNPATGCAGYVHGPFIDVVSGDAGDTSKGILVFFQFF
jgi:hypothetical protein